MLAESKRNVRQIAEIFARKMESARVRLLWGTASLFTDRRSGMSETDSDHPGLIQHGWKRDGDDREPDPSRLQSGPLDLQGGG